MNRIARSADQIPVIGSVVVPVVAWISQRLLAVDRPVHASCQRSRPRPRSVLAADAAEVACA